MRARRPIACMLSALSMVGLSAVFTGTPAAAAAAATTAAALPKPDHIVIVMMENEDDSTIIGNSAQAPYINSLAAAGASFSAATGEWHPSLPNYYALLSGSTQSLTDSTPPATGSINADNLPNELSLHGLSFSSYTDEYTPAAWLRFADLPGTATAPNPVDKWLSCPAPAAGQACGFPSTAAGYAGLPTVTFAHGNASQSMHDGNVLEGDTWVKNTFAGYAQWALTHNSMLIVTWDEDDFTTANHIPTVFYGANVKPGTYSEPINHYNMLRTIEDMYGLPDLANTSTVPAITDTWGATTYGGAGTGPVTGYESRCLDDSGSGTADGNPILLWSCSGNANQNWTLPGDGTVHVLGKCMDVTHSGMTAGTKVQLYTCNGGGAQQWQAQADGSLVNPESGMCLDDPGFSVSGAQLEIWSCNGGANQNWNLPA